jgi:hypothetical protein
MIRFCGFTICEELATIRNGNSASLLFAIDDLGMASASLLFAIDDLGMASASLFFAVGDLGAASGDSLAPVRYIKGWLVGRFEATYG